MTIKIPSLDSLRNLSTKKSIIKKDDGSYEVVTTNTRKMDAKTVLLKVEKLEKEIASIKEDYPDVFKK